LCVVPPQRTLGPLHTCAGGAGRPQQWTGPMIMAAAAGDGMDASKKVEADPSADAQATHVPCSRLTIGSWNLVAKYDEHVLLSLYWFERKLVWEVLHLGVVRKMEVDFEDVSAASLATAGGDEPERLILELARPPRFYKEATTDSSQVANYVYTTDFTNGQASQVSRHILYFPRGAISSHAGEMKRAGLPLRVESGGAHTGNGLQSLEGGSRGGAVHAMAARLRQPPTSSPRLDAIILQEQLEREMRECQARYTGICPVRARMYAAAFDELILVIARDEPKRGSVLRRVRDEARMSIDSYRTVFETSLGFGCGKLTQAVEIKGDLEEQINSLEREIRDLTVEAKQLGELCESLEHRAERKAKASEVKDKELVDLAAEKQQLEDLLVVLRLSKQDRAAGK